MSDYDEIRQRKLQELREQQEAQQKFAQIEEAVKNYFTPNALQRYGNIRSGHPETALRLIMLLAQSIQAGQLKQKIDDDMLKKILSQLTQTRDIKIIRK